MSSTLPSDWGHVRLGQQIEIVYGRDCQSMNALVKA